MTNYTHKHQVITAEEFFSDDNELLGYTVHYDQATSVQLRADVFNNIFVKYQAPFLNFGQVLEKLKVGAAVARQDTEADVQSPKYIVFIKPDGTLGRIYIDNSYPAGEWLSLIHI